MGLLTLGTLDKFKRGWALMPFSGKCAHWWEDVTKEFPSHITPRGRVRVYKSSCGVLGFGDDGIKPLHQGNFPSCKRCIKKLNKKVKHLL